MNNKEKIYLLETKIEELETEKKRLHTIIKHFAFQNNVNNNFIKNLINLCIDCSAAFVPNL